MSKYWDVPLLLVLCLPACAGESNQEGGSSEDTNSEDDAESSGDGTSTDSGDGDGDGDVGGAELEWILHLDGLNPGFNEIEERGDELILAGSFYETSLTIDGQTVDGQGTRSAFLAVLERETGGVSELQALSGGATDFVSLRAVEVEDDGSLVGTLYHRSPVEFGGTTLPAAGAGERGHLVAWTADHSQDWAVGFGDDANIQLTAEGLQKNEDGTWSVVGSFSGPLDLGDGDLASGKPSGLFGARVAQDGTISQAWGGGGDSVGLTDANLRADGTSVLAGRFDDSFDFAGIDTDFPSGFFMEVGSDGTVEWALGAPNATADAIALASDGGAYAGGQFRVGLDLGGQTVTAPEDDGYYARIGADGTVLWAKRLGNDQFGIVHEMVETPDGLWITGLVRSPHPVGDELLGAGDDDSFIARANPETGEIYWFELIGGPEPEGWSGVWADQDGNIYAGGQTFGMSYGGIDIEPDEGGTHGYLAKFSPT